MDVHLKRAYVNPSPSDGPRVLVDRIWPRGVAKESANITHWLKGLAPSTQLRKWFGHDPDKWPEFRKRYLRELAAEEAGEDLEKLKNLLEEHNRVTLVFAAKDTEHNNAAALRDFILNNHL